MSLTILEEVATVSRRTVLGGAAGLCFAFALPVQGQQGTARAGDLRPNAWIRLLPDETVIIYSGASEMGQGTMTALPLILAEELDADWSKVRIEMSPVDETLYGNPRLGNLMLTIASYAVAGYFTALRLAGAKARASLMRAVSEHLKVPVGELSTEPGAVVHAASGRRMSFGDIARQIDRLPDPPDLKEQDLKPTSQFRLIGRDVLRRDHAAKVDGSAQYAINVDLPGLVQATVFHAPVPGALVQGFRLSGRVPDGVSARALGTNAVALVGRSMADLLKARQNLKITWSATALDTFNDAEVHATYRNAARDTALVTRVWDKKGDAAAVQSAGTRHVEREYGSDYYYHAQIEPLNAVCSVTDGGTRAEVWAGTQAPAYAVQQVARALGIAPAAVTLHRSYSGGAFGRRGAFDQDYVVDAALLSRDLGKPVKAIWTREEDVRAGRYRPMTAQWVKATIAPDGVVSAWRHRVSCEDPLITTDPPRYKARNETPAIAMLGTNIPSYAIDNVLIEFARQPTGVRVSPMRGVGAPVNRFAVECFVDELAQELLLDPLQMRRRLLKDSPRGLHVLEHVAAMAKWGAATSGRAQGLAYSDYGGAYLAVIAEVSVDRSSGVVRVHRIWAALDPGMMIQPDTVRSSIEGGLIFGTSSAIKERMSFKNGRAEQSSFFDYPVLRMSEAPDVQVDLVISSASPAGVAEAAPVVAPAAIANAFATLTGRRIRHIPLHPSRVLQALA